MTEMVSISKYLVPPLNAIDIYTLPMLSRHVGKMTDYVKLFGTSWVYAMILLYGSILIVPFGNFTPLWK